MSNQSYSYEVLENFLWWEFAVCWVFHKRLATITWSQQLCHSFQSDVSVDKESYISLFLPLSPSFSLFLPLSPSFSYSLFLSPSPFKCPGKVFHTSGWNSQLFLESEILSQCRARANKTFLGLSFLKSTHYFKLIIRAYSYLRVKAQLSHRWKFDLGELWPYFLWWAWRLDRAFKFEPGLVSPLSVAEILPSMQRKMIFSGSLKSGTSRFVASWFFLLWAEFVKNPICWTDHFCQKFLLSGLIRVDELGLEGKLNYINPILKWIG